MIGEEQYFLVNVKVQMETSRGSLKTVTEQYLTRASSVTEAEANIVKDFKESGDIRDYCVDGAKSTKILKVV